MDEKCRVIEYLEGSLSDGGAETLVKDYVLFLDKLIFEPIILVDWIFTDSANYARLKGKEIKIISLYPSYSFFWRLINKFFRNIYIDYKLKKIIKKIKPDVIHIHLAALKHVAKIRKELGNTKLFYTCHSIPKVYFEEKRGEKEAAKLLIASNGLKLIALHDSMKLELEEIFKVPVFVVNNGIDIYRFKHPQKTREEVRKNLGISNDSFVIGHIGRFVPVKNHGFILRVFSRILERKQKSVLLLIGSGPGEKIIKDEIKKSNLEKNVIILHSRTDIPELLNCMDVFFFPSLYEGFPCVLLEAQASYLPCYVSDTISREVFLTNYIKPLSLNDSPQIWADAICDNSIKTDFPDRLEEYDIRNSVKKLESIYLED